MAYKAEHVTDLHTDLVLATATYPAGNADNSALGQSIVALIGNLHK